MEKSTKVLQKSPESPETFFKVPKKKIRTVLKAPEDRGHSVNNTEYSIYSAS
jgi:hypothetical protein